MNVYKDATTSRSKKIKTESSARNHEFDSFKNAKIDNTESPHLLYSLQDEQIMQELPQGIVRQQIGSIEDVFNHIQTPVNYDDLSNEQIRKEKHILEEYVRFLNFQTNEMIERKKEVASPSRQRFLSQSGSRKHPKLTFSKLSGRVTAKQVQNNAKLIHSLRQQYSFLKTKLQNFEKSENKIKNDNEVKKIEDQIRLMKFDIYERRQKSEVTEKNIKQLKSRDLHKVFFDAQQEYVQLLKKKEQYQRKLENIIGKNARIVEEEATTEDKYEHIKEWAFQEAREVKHAEFNDHNRAIYDAKRRKMELLLRRRERQEEANQKKYYDLLKRFERMVEAGKILDSNLEELELEVGERAEQYNKKKRIATETSRQQLKATMYRDQEYRTSSNIEKSEESGGFMLTQVEREKPTALIECPPLLLSREELNMDSAKSRSRFDVRRVKNREHKKLKSQEGLGECAKESYILQGNDKNLPHKKTSVIQKLRQTDLSLDEELKSLKKTEIRKEFEEKQPQEQYANDFQELSHDSP